MHADDVEFEELLTAALYRASELDCEDMPSDEQLERLVHPSLRFQRKMNALVRSPARHIRNRRRPVYLRALLAAASALIAVAVLLGGVMVVSPTVRAAVIGFVQSWFENRTEYRIPESPVEDNWTLNYVPAGFSITAEMTNDIQVFRVYENETSEHIFVEISAGQKAVNNEYSVYYQTTISGRIVDVYEAASPEHSSVLVIYDAPSGVFITLSSPIQINELMKIAENISK